MEDENSEDLGVIEEDYYTFLNVPRDVSINPSYQNLEIK